MLNTSILELMSKHITITKRVAQFCIQSSAWFASPAAIARWTDSVHLDRLWSKCGLHDIDHLGHGKCTSLGEAITQQFQAK